MKEPYKLPPDWKWGKLGEVCEKLEYGYTASAEYQEVGPKFLRITDIQDGKVKWEKVPYCRVNDNNDKINKYLLKAGDILFARTGGTTGKSYLILEVPPNAIFASYLIRVRSGNDLIPNYLYHFLQSDLYWSQVNAHKRGGAQPNMNASLLYNVVLPLPPLPEQHRIAAKLQELMQNIEHARNACEKQLSAAKSLHSAYLRKVFESEEAKKWERKRLGEVCDYDSGIWGEEPNGSSPCYPVLRSNNIHDGKMVFDNIAMRKIDQRYVGAKKLKTGDILVTTSSGSRDLLGKSALFVQPPDGKTYLFSNFTMRLSPKSEMIDFIFLYFYLQSPRAKEILKLLQDTTTGLRNMDKKEFLNQMVPLHPLETQHRIASDLQEKMAYIEKLRTSIEKQLEAINTLPQAILKKAFRGEL